MAKKKSTVGSIGAAISNAASAVVGAADRNVVQPVGKALGLIDKKPKKKTTTKKAKPAAAVMAAVKKVVAKKPTAKKKTITKKK